MGIEVGLKVDILAVHSVSYQYSVWKVNEVEKRKEAKPDKSLSLYSPPFLHYLLASYMATKFEYV